MIAWSNDKIFNLSSGKGYTLNQIIKLIEKISNTKVKVEYIKGRSIDVPVNVLDNRSVEKAFNWKPETSIEDGMKLVYNYLQNADDR